MNETERKTPARKKAAPVKKTTRTKKVSNINDAPVKPDSIYQALALFNARGIKVQEHGENAYQNYDYATYTDIVDACKAPALECGFSWYHENGTSPDREGVYFSTVFFLISDPNSKVVCTDWIPDGITIKERGGLQTYYQRYHVRGVLALGISDDDDPDQEPTSSRRPPASKAEARRTEAKKAEAKPPVEKEKPDVARQFHMRIEALREIDDQKVSMLMEDTGVNDYETYQAAGPGVQKRFSDGMKEIIKAANS